MRAFNSSLVLLAGVVVGVWGCSSDESTGSQQSGGAGKSPSGGSGGTGASGGAAPGGKSGAGVGGASGTAGKAASGGSSAGALSAGGSSGKGGSATGGSPAAGTGGTDGGAAGEDAGPTGGTPNGGGMAGSSGSGPLAGAPNGGAAPLGNPVVYVGGSSDVRIYDFNRDTGAFTAHAQDPDLGPSPSYFALSPNKKILFVTNEDDGSMGGLTTAAIGADGDLTPINHQSGTDGGFTFVAVSPAGNFAIGASYNGGSASVFPVATDGTLGAQSDNRDFGGMAQTHCIAFTSAGDHVLIPNKGNDEVAQLLFSSDGKLTPNTPASVPAADGAGPRHIALHPNGKLAFVIDELDSTMVPYQLATNGTLTAGTPVSTLPSGFNGQNSGAHVEITPDGKFVYGSNRGHDSIVAFSADQTTGALTLVEHEPSGGDTPRDFDMDPAGGFIIVANQGTSTIAAFHIESDGKLTALGNAVSGPQGAEAVQILYLP